MKSCVDFRQTVCVGGGAQREGGLMSADHLLTSGAKGTT